MISRFRKISALLLAFYFLGISIGFSMDTHYCMGKIEAVSFFGNKASCSEHEDHSCKSNQCSVKHKNNVKQHCKMDAKDCCFNKEISIKIDSKTIQSPQLSKVESPKISSIDLLIITPDDENQNITIGFISDDLIINYSPPPFILFQQLLFYH